MGAQMRGLGLTVACVILSAGAAAQAQTIDATGATSASLTRNATPGGTTLYGNGETDGIWSSGGRGGSFEAIVEITQSHVSFESGVAVSGPFSAATSRSGVDITISNFGGQDIEVTNFGSTIIPAGLGFYLQDRVGPATDNNIFTGYGQTNSALTFQDLVSTVGTGITNPFAFADFDFEITSLEQTLYSLSGSISLYFDTEGNVQQAYNLNDASVALTGFTAVHDTPNNPFAYAFAWDATDIVVPLNAYLTEGQSQTISYQTRVTAYTRADCITAVTCLVAYSGFGDPIGRGGGVDSLSQFSALGDMEMISMPLNDQNFGNPITGIVFDPVEFDPFRVITAGVPEPSTWMTMIMGFGLLGASLRRRRTAFARI